MRFSHRSMENVDLHGDLSDVVRGGSGGFRPSMDDASVTDSINNNFQELSNAKVSPVSAPRLIKPAPIEPPVAVPRPPGVKRRKGQAKRVICIPAPAADQEGNIKASSVVVPSDLWAWRKYGQKPIKGSPYPRGYYRCSSSKGCLARKQVERSRSDPKMLVITYTSEHNHPWPTHRNSLAGSSRSTNTTQHSKSSKNSIISTRPTKNEAIKEENVDFEGVIDNSYEPLMLDYSNDMEFFDELGELEPNPMSFFFDNLEEEGVDNKDNVDVLSYFDWNGD